MGTRRPPAFLGFLRRLVEGIVPAEDGGPPMAMRHARTRLLWLIGGGVGLVFGSLVGLLVALAWHKLPDVPLLLLGLLVGFPLGIATSVAAVHFLGLQQRTGGWAYLLVPLLVAAAPFLVIGSTWVALHEKRRRR